MADGSVGAFGADNVRFTGVLQGMVGLPSADLRPSDLGGTRLPGLRVTTEGKADDGSVSCGEQRDVTGRKALHGDSNLMEFQHMASTGPEL